jgi:hypothetical protein
VAARVIDGRLDEVVYTIETGSGAWVSVSAKDVHPLAGSEERSPGTRRETVKGMS